MSYGVLYAGHYYVVNRDEYYSMMELEYNKEYDAIELLIETSDSIKKIY